MTTTVNAMMMKAIMTSMMMTMGISTMTTVVKIIIFTIITSKKTIMPKLMTVVTMTTEMRLMSRYSGAFSCVSRVVSEEGVCQLYRGLGPALLRQAVYGSIK